MQSASGQTYVSKKVMQAYEKQRAKNIKKKSAQQQQPAEESKGTEEEAKLTVVKDVLEKKASDSDLDDDEYEKQNRSFEEVNSDELDGNLDASSDEEEAVRRTANVKQKAAWKSAPRRQFQQEVDTNIFKIDFANLKDKAELATGDAFFCAKCGAVFNMHSVIAEVDGKQIWNCEFCMHAQEVDLDDEEKPKSKSVNYIVEGAAQAMESKAGGKKDISVVFCVDQSGSMCVSQPVKGKHQIKNDRTKDLQGLMKFSDGSNQIRQNERNITYVSRMQCLQAAIDQQITDMNNGALERKLGIVSFNNEVTVYGDGSQDSQIITGDKLNDYDYLVQNGADQGKTKMQLTVKDSAASLKEKLMALEETGPTALGPAVATSIAMAAEGATGSQVVICTDGLANIGVGAFDEAKTEEDWAKVNQFYEQIGQYAKSKGVTVNIVSITGDECNLDSLSTLADLTGGEVQRVDPVELTKNFANILSLPIIASNVVAKVKLHKGLTFRNEDPASLSDDKMTMVRDIGNVTEETEITFEYTLKKIRDLAKMEDIDLTKIQAFPFQTQIEFTALDGSKCIRVITETQSISNNKEELQRKADYRIIGSNALQHQQAFAKGGNHRFAQAYAKVNKRAMMRGAATDEQMAVKEAFVARSKGMYNQMQMQDQQEQFMDMGMDETSSRMVSQQLNQKVMSKGKKKAATTFVPEAKSMPARKAMPMKRMARGGKKMGGGGGGGPSPRMAGMAMGMQQPIVQEQLESEDEAEEATAILAAASKFPLPKQEKLSVPQTKTISSAFTGAKKKTKMSDEYTAAIGSRSKKSKF